MIGDGRSRCRRFCCSRPTRSDAAAQRGALEEVVARGTGGDGAANPNPPPGREQDYDQRKSFDLTTAFATQQRFLLHDLQTPISDDQAERYLRATKLHRRISGCFRSQHGAEGFAHLCSYPSPPPRTAYPPAPPSPTRSKAGPRCRPRPNPSEQLFLCLVIPLSAGPTRRSPFTKGPNTFNCVGRVQRPDDLRQTKRLRFPRRQMTRALHPLLDRAK